MLERQQDFWNRVRLLLQCIQAGAPVDEARRKLNALTDEFGVDPQDVATAFQMMGELNGAEHGGNGPGHRSVRDVADG